MSAFLIDVPMPAMGATVSELTVINIVVGPGTQVAKGQKLAELESDKSAFDFESPADGTILEVRGNKGDVKKSGETLFRMETADESLRHLEVKGGGGRVQGAGNREQGTGNREQGTRNREQGTAGGGAGPGSSPPATTSAKPLVWTPRALKMAQEAGLDPATITGIEATGPGGRVSGDDVTKYLAK